MERKLTQDCTEYCQTHEDRIHVCIDNVIGHGSTGNVYKGYYESSTIPCAVKIVSKSNDVEILRKITATNPNGSQHLLRYFGTVETENQYVIAMELCDRDLENLGDIEFFERIKLARELCEGLKALHDHQIVHGDIKPNKVLLKRLGYTIKIGFAMNKKLHQNVETCA